MDYKKPSTNFISDFIIFMIAIVLNCVEILNV